MPLTELASLRTSLPRIALPPFQLPSGVVERSELLELAEAAASSTAPALPTQPPPPPVGQQGPAAVSILDPDALQAVSLDGGWRKAAEGWVGCTAGHATRLPTSWSLRVVVEWCNLRLLWVFGRCCPPAALWRQALPSSQPARSWRRSLQVSRYLDDPSNQGQLHAAAHAIAGALSERLRNNSLEASPGVRLRAGWTGSLWASLWAYHLRIAV